MKAIIIGATGLVGSLILNELLADNYFTEVRIFVRKPSGISSSKLIEIVNPLSDINEISAEIKGDVLFNAMGTTIKQAGSQAEQQRIDRDLPVNFARIASENRVKIMLNVSSVGASLNGNFYLKTKAEMENSTQAFFPETTFHFRPSFLTGNRKDFRLGEKSGIVLMKIIDPLLIGNLRKYRSMPADKLAKAMVNLSKNSTGKPNILHYTEIIELQKSI